MKATLLECKINYTKTTLEKGTLTALIWVKNDKETGENHTGII